MNQKNIITEGVTVGFGDQCIALEKAVPYSNRTEALNSASKENGVIIGCQRISDGSFAGWLVVPPAGGYIDAQSTWFVLNVNETKVLRVDLS